MSGQPVPEEKEGLGRKWATGAAAVEEQSAMDASIQDNVSSGIPLHPRWCPLLIQVSDHSQAVSARGEPDRTLIPSETFNYRKVSLPL